jgi:hypothetical protein
MAEEQLPEEQYLAEEQLPEKQYVRVDIRGQDPALWGTLRAKLMVAVEDLLNTVVDSERGTTLQDEARQLTSAALDHVRARLAKAGLENEKIEAEIQRLYAQIQGDLADARKKSAEADAIEFATAMKRLRVVLGGMRAMLIGEEGDEAIIFGRQIDEFIKVLITLT